ncbi:hypothetical protein G6O67_001174 [Ophiocordyceps sinensis]|uniref:Uncharacterized protein n=1 Tax=Ophiocordyceps sinensis TaxID=72228 RepID=A0A8H4V8M1_9HYPO|nr:hypothetical protein G6O67_001174 [Ophiocordyceps sinensis]
MGTMVAHRPRYLVNPAIIEPSPESCMFAETASLHFILDIVNLFSRATSKGRGKKRQPLPLAPPILQAVSFSVESSSFCQPIIIVSSSPFAFLDLRPAHVCKMVMSRRQRQSPSQSFSPRHDVVYGVADLRT